MIKKTIVAIAVAAIACAAGASTASAAKHKHTAAAPPPASQAETIPGVNPMTNASPTPAVKNAQPFAKQPGVNPM
jgi:ABC-type glycerol-3-phosphate transport system substrate-binding protein